MLNWIVWNKTDYFIKMDLALDNQQRLIRHKTQSTNQTTIQFKPSEKSEILEMWPVDQTIAPRIKTSKRSK